METILQKIKIENKFTIFILTLLPLSFCIGQAAVAIFFFLISILFFYLFFFKKIKLLENDSSFLLLLILLLFFLSLLISSSFSKLPLITIERSIFYLRFFFFFMMGIFFIKFNFKKFYNIQNIYFLFLLILITFVTIDGYYQYFSDTKENLFGFKPKPEHFPRLTGIFKDEPIIGSFLFHVGFPAIIFLISYLNYQIQNNLLKFFFITIVISIYLLIIALSGERTSLMMVFFSFLLISPFILINKKNLFISLALFLGIFYILIENNTYVKQRYSIFVDEISIKNIFLKKNISKDNKNYEKNFFDSQWGAHYLTAAEMISENHLFGIGIRNFRYQCSDPKFEQINSLSKDTRCSSHPHNIYLEILSETGLISAIFFVSFLLIFFYQCIKIILKSNKIKAKYVYQYNIFLSFIIVCLAMFFPFKATGSFYSNFYGSFIWYNLTILYVYLKYFQNLIKKNI
jgi:O-antigen ligase